jgi:hypothetical protein
MAIAAPNSAGGFDYQLTTFGAPPPLEPCVGYFPFLCNSRGPVSNFAGQLFPSVTPSIPYAGSAWTNPPSTNLGFASNEGGLGKFTPPNLGTTTAGTMNGYSCVSEVLNPADCSSGALIGNTTFGPAGGFPPVIIQLSSPGIENLQGKISTNAAGTILVAKFSVSQEFSTLVGFPAFSHPDSFNGNYITLSEVPAAVVADTPHTLRVDKNNAFQVNLLGSAGFDVNDVDLTSLQLGNAEYALPPFRSESDADQPISVKELNGDGIDDLKLKFNTADATINCGSQNVKLRGTVSNGTPFETTVVITGEGKACD